MKIPLRFQVTEFDCRTVSISYLFKRKEIPAELVKAIHKYNLDYCNEFGNLGQGETSQETINKLTNWITRHANLKNFNIKCERLEGEFVTLEKTTDHLNNHVCVFTKCWQACEHYDIINKINNNMFIYLSHTI